MAGQDGFAAQLVRKMSKLSPNTSAACRITWNAHGGELGRGESFLPAAAQLGTQVHSQGVGDDELLPVGNDNDSFAEPEWMASEESVTFGRPPPRATSRSTTLRHVGSVRRGRAPLSCEPSQGGLACCVVDEGSQADFGPPPETEVTRLLLARAQHEQLAELSLLSARLRHQEQSFHEAAAQVQQTQVQEAQEQASRLQQSQARAAELQQQVEELRGELAASAAAGSRAADAELEAQLRGARQRVAELESKVAALELERSRLGARCSELQQLSSTVARLVRTAGTLPEDAGSDGAGAQECGTDTEDGVAAVERLLAAHAALQERYVTESKQRRELHNQVMDMKGAIRVFCRVRPLSEKEQAASQGMACLCDPLNNNVEVVCGRVGGAAKAGGLSTDLKRLKFEFDRVFGPGFSQEQIFRDTSAMVCSVLDGYNACIFAYGQTGSGKTYTMEGTEEDRGVNYRAMQELFDVAAKRSVDANCTVTVSLMEVYLDQIHDLLSDGSDRLEIKTAGAGGMHLPGLTEVEVTTPEQAWALLQTASAARHAAATAMNKCSSRSHCLLCLRVDGRSKLTSSSWRSRLWLVDLAGSERVSKTEAAGERLQEAQFINKSLSALGDCIYALAAKSPHVPFRNSKLTHLLQESLAGAGKTLMFVNVSPTDADAPETVCSLSFASRVRGVELGAARKNVVTDSGGGSEAVKDLKAVVAALQEQVSNLEAEKQELEQWLHAEHHTAQQPHAQHCRTDTASSLGSRMDAVLGVFAGQRPCSPTAGSPPRWGLTRSLSAPEPQLAPNPDWVTAGCEALQASCSGAQGTGVGGQRLLAHRRLGSAGGIRPPSPCSSGCDSPGGGSTPRSRLAPTPGTVRSAPRSPVPRLQLSAVLDREAGSGKGAVTPGYLARTEAMARRARPGTPGAESHDEGGSSAPSSVRSTEGSKSAPASPGRAARSVASPRSATSATLKAWRPESSGSKPTRSRWS